MTLEADLAAASDPSTPAEALMRLSRSRSPRVKRAVAENLAAPKEALAKLFKEFPDLVVSNPASALFDMEYGVLAWIPQNVREILAKEVQTPTIVLERLAAYEDVYVRIEIAGNANTPKHVLECLAVNDDPDVRVAVAGNVNTPKDELNRLAMDEDGNVRLAIAENASTPKNVLRILVKDEDDDVVKTAKARLSK